MVAVGAIVGWIFDRRADRTPRPDATKQLGVLLASGLIVGESLLAVVVAGLVAFADKLGFSNPKEPLALVGPGFETAGKIVGGLAFTAITFVLYRWILRMATTRSA